MQPQLPLVLEANESYRRAGFHAAPRTPQPARHLVVLTCMDARLDLFHSLGLDVGDAHILRNAGGRASDDAIRSLVVSAHLLGTREVGIIHHTNCGLEGLSDEQIADRTGVRGLGFLSFPDLHQSVVDDVEIVRSCGHLPDDFVVWGAIYDVDTGAVRVVVEPDGPLPAGSGAR